MHYAKTESQVTGEKFPFKQDSVHLDIIVYSSEVVKRRGKKKKKKLYAIGRGTP